MAKEILLYSPILNITAESFIKQLNDADKEDLTVRINSPGGSVFAGWGIIAKSLEYKGNLSTKVDGNASSMMAIYLLYQNNVEALDTSTFTLHRAATSSRDPKDLEMLEGINANIRKAFESKLNIARFEEISGITLDAFFNDKERIDVNLNASQAKEIGLISKINVLEPADFEALSLKFAAMSDAKKENKIVNNKNNNNTEKMNVEELKSNHPEVYSAVFNAGSESGVKAERDRSGSWLAFADADIEAVVKGVKDGEVLSATAMAELSRKAFSAQALNGMEEESADVVTPGDTKTGDEPTAMSDFEKEVNEQFKIGK